MAILPTGKVHPETVYRAPLSNVRRNAVNELLAWPAGDDAELRDKFVSQVVAHRASDGHRRRQRDHMFFLIRMQFHTVHTHVAGGGNAEQQVSIWRAIPNQTAVRSGFAIEFDLHRLGLRTVEAGSDIYGVQPDAGIRNGFVVLVDDAEPENFAALKLDLKRAGVSRQLNRDRRRGEPLGFRREKALARLAASDPESTVGTADGFSGIRSVTKPHEHIGVRHRLSFRIHHDAPHDHGATEPKCVRQPKEILRRFRISRDVNIAADVFRMGGRSPNAPDCFLCDPINAP